MRFALIFCALAISKHLLIVLCLPNENDSGEPLFIKEARNFGGILGGGTGIGGGGFPGIGSGSNIRFYKLNVPTKPPGTQTTTTTTTKAPLTKELCCKHMCADSCNDADGADPAQHCLVGGSPTAGTPCVNSAKYPECKTFAEKLNDPNCKSDTGSCPADETMVCPK